MNTQRFVLGTEKHSFPFVFLAILQTVLTVLPANSSNGVELTFGRWPESTTRNDPDLLDGTWEVTTNDGKNWHSINVPGTIEDQIDVEFDGVSQYRKSFEVKLREEKRAILRFEGVATHASVSLNGKKLGEHLGGWTPFEFDITDALIASQGIGVIEVAVDERVGHNTQGFLPIIAPHFGGIWKRVRIDWRDQVFVDMDHVKAIGNSADHFINLAMPLNSNRPIATAFVEHRIQINDGRWTEWSSPKKLQLEPLPPANDFLHHQECWRYQLATQVNVENVKRWHMDHPDLYRVEFRLQGQVGKKENVIKDDIAWRTSGSVRSAFRSVSTRGRQLLLNDEPLVVRGLLNWGYAPPSVAPTLDEAKMKEEIVRAKSLGFNLMKFCLWVPPKRYLELCDEMGMLAWVEYPTWHPDFSEKHRENLLHEYREFFHYDRNHPSVILRSLTCETGPSASLDVITEIYQLCKTEIPGAIVEDDSSWIEWNRVHDFYDDHPYGNNHAWQKTLERLNAFIDQRDAKPLILGESIAADTWLDPDLFVPIKSNDFSQPWFVEANAAWEKRMRDRGADFDNYDDRSRRYALRMRKYQIETFRRLVSEGGYVVSVIRDFPKASMGLIDYQDKMKWTVEDWRFHRDDSLLLAEIRPKRSYFFGEFKPPKLVWKQGAEPEVSIGDIASVLSNPKLTTQIASGDQSDATELDSGSEPRRIRYTAKLVGSNRDNTKIESENHWDFWLFPRPSVQARLKVLASDQAILDMAKEMTSIGSPENAEVWLVDRISVDVLKHLKLGGTAICLPNGEVGSFRLSDHWFLRGGPVAFQGTQIPNVRSAMLMDLQHFDLAASVIPNVDSMLDSIDPILMLWDNHDTRDIRTHGLTFSMPVGRGTLLVSALRHTGDDNAAGRWLLSKFVNHLVQQKVGRSDRGDKNYRRLTAELSRAEVALHTRKWKFKPDARFAGVDEKWYDIGFDDKSWGNITCDRHWEGQGHDSLDGWAWYRLDCSANDIPGTRRPGAPIYLNFTGVDDHYRVWVNGKYVGEDGEIETKQTAFDRRKSFEISSLLKKDQRIQITVAVYDWYGAGGIFRPVTLSTQPLSDDRPWLK